MNYTIKINKTILKEIINHSKKNKFVEIGGYLLGKNIIYDDGIIIIVNGIYYEKNRFGSENRFNFSPLYLYNAIEFAKINKMMIVGNYHSHAQYPALFSNDDRIMESKMKNNTCAIIYSLVENRLIGDIIINNNIFIKSRITLFGNEDLENKINIEKKSDYKSLTYKLH